MEQNLLFVFIAVFALDSIVPGPAVAMVMSRGAASGLRRTLSFIAGLVIGDLLLFVGALFGLAALAAAMGPLFQVIKWIGIAYLLYLAYTTWHAPISDIAIGHEDTAGVRTFGLALILPLGNPKAVGFYAALLPSVMDVAHLNIATAVQFGVAIVAIWSTVLVGYTLLADRGRSYFSGTSLRKWMNRGAAGAMAGAAGTVAFRE